MNQQAQKQHLDSSWADKSRALSSFFYAVIKVWSQDHRDLLQAVDCLAMFDTGTFSVYNLLL